MTWAITALATATVLSARSQSNAAKADEIALETQADQEELAAESRELARRQKLNKVLAANVVSMSDAGVMGEGTPAAVAIESAKQASLSEGIEGLSDRLRSAQLRRQASQTGQAGELQAAGTLLQGGFQTTQLGG